MLIRTKLLLLAGIPLPVLLVLAAAALSSSYGQWRQAERLSTGMALVKTMREEAAALAAHRDAEAAQVTERSRGLESLLLGEAAAAERPGPAIPPLPADRLAAMSLDGLSESVRGGAQNFAATLERLRARTVSLDSATLVDVCAPYDVAFRQASGLPEQLAGSAGSAERARELRALAIADRYAEALAKERIYARHAIATNTLPPRLVREFSANEGIKLLERTLIEEVAGNELLKSQMAAARDRAARGGRDETLQQIRAFADRQDQLALLYGSLGYGGLTYYFHNFLVHGEERDRNSFEARAAEAEGAVNGLLASGGLSEVERADLNTIATAIQTYRTRLRQIASLRSRGAPASRIDALAQVDDEPVVAALGRLASFRPAVTAQQWETLSTTLLADVGNAAEQLAQRIEAGVHADRDDRRRQMAVLASGTAATLLLLALFAIALYRRMTHGIRALVQEFDRVARTGDVQARAVVQGADELAQLNRAVAAIGQRLQVAADAAESMAAGDLVGTLAPLGPQDRLAHAMGALAASARAVVAQAQAISAGDYASRVEPRSPRDTLAFALADMGQALRKFRDDTQRSQWLSAGQLQVLAALGNADAPELLGERALTALAGLTGAELGVMYLNEPDGLLAIARRATPEVDVAERLAPREGLVSGALGRDRTELLTKLPAGFLRLKTGLGEGDVAAVTLTPLRARGEAVGVLELGWMTPPDERTRGLLDAVAEPLGLALVAAEARRRTDALLEETRRQAARLREQQEELRQSNEELEAQARLLRQSEEELKAQREELQATNEELEEKSNLLQRQREELEKTARDLAQATKYKSEFLANMSHELRTPLNSLLILSRSLMENDQRNLTDEQVQAARVIHDGGRDLLNLINDILDLSKVEAGRLDVHLQPFETAALVDGLRRQFEPVARDKGLALVLEVGADVPAEIVSDRQRVEQILRNLLSNALKFTEKGSVTLRIARVPQRGGEAEGAIAFSVEDTGIGIPDHKLELIFQAFQQADGSTSRRYGGTGLGLTIARQLAALLGGQVRVSSKVGEGSRFTLVLPERAAVPLADAAVTPAFGTGEAPAEPAEAATPPADKAPIEDDREGLAAGQRSMLVVEDDLRFAAVMRDVVRKRGYKCVVAVDGASALRLARRFLPSAILLDLKLPDMDGQRVLEILKWSPATRHIPVHVVSAMAPSNEPLKRGAIGFLHKPAELSDLQQVVDRLEATLTAEQRTVLVVEDDRGSQAAIRALLEGPRTRVVSATTAAQALETLGQEHVDCIVLDLSLPDTDGIQLLEQLRRDRRLEHPPVVIYTARELSAAEHRKLSELAQSIVIKGAASPDRLVDDVLLFLHAVESDLPEAQKQMVARLHSGADAFEGKKILVADDDLRNVFALSGLLRKRGLEVIVADNGKMALERLNEHPDINAVLMDIMMPVMDGFEALRHIREDPRFRELPVIAVTAKAMAEDRRRCMEAGASDYLSKPIELDALLAMLRVWLGRPA